MGTFCPLLPDDGESDDDEADGDEVDESGDEEDDGDYEVSGGGGKPEMTVSEALMDELTADFEGMELDEIVTQLRTQNQQQREEIQTLTETIAEQQARIAELEEQFTPKKKAGRTKRAASPPRP